MIDVIQTGPFGVNTCVVALDGRNAFVIDPACCEFCHDETAVSDFLSAKSLELKAVILTHGHFDHVAGLSVLKRDFPDVPVLIHKADSCFIGETGGDFQGEELRAMGFAEFIPSVASLPQADFFLDDGKLLSDFVDAAGMEKWRVIHTPGHTKGSCCVFNAEEKILLSGDTVFFHSWGRTDLYGGSDSEMQKSLSLLYRTLPPETKVYPGHDRFGFRLSENL